MQLHVVAGVNLNRRNADETLRLTGVVTAKASALPDLPGLCNLLVR